jgi:hypothetical protein
MALYVLWPDRMRPRRRAARPRTRAVAAESPA